MLKFLSDILVNKNILCIYNINLEFKEVVIVVIYL